MLLSRVICLWFEEVVPHTSIEKEKIIVTSWKQSLSGKGVTELFLPGRQDVLWDLKEKHTVCTSLCKYLCSPAPHLSGYQERTNMSHSRRKWLCFVLSRKNLKLSSPSNFARAKLKMLSGWTEDICSWFLILFMMMIMLLYPYSFGCSDITHLVVSNKTKKKLSIKLT